MNTHTIEGTLRFGAAEGKADHAVVLVHGRGSSPRDIAGLSGAFTRPGTAFVVPAATGGSWYPERFLVPRELNEPWLSGALKLFGALVTELTSAGIPRERIGWVGFSQGACLALDFVSLNPARYAFVAGLSGALIGPPGVQRPTGGLGKTPILLGCAESDGHIPIDYVRESAQVLAAQGGAVTTQVFPGAGHTIFPDEIAWLKKAAAE